MEEFKYLMGLEPTAMGAMDLKYATVTKEPQRPFDIHYIYRLKCPIARNIR
jgi:hypothetical protein